MNTRTRTRTRASCGRATRRALLGGLLALGLLGAAAPARAQGGRQPEVTAQLSTGIAKLGEVLSCTVEVANARDAQLGAIPQVDGLTIGSVKGPNVQSFMSWTNGRRTSSRTIGWTFALRADREGDFVIPPIPVDVDGKRYMTRELLLRAVQDLKGKDLGYFEYVGLPESVYEGQVFELELRFGWDEAKSESINLANLILPWWGQLPGALEVESNGASFGQRSLRINLNSRSEVAVEDLGRAQVRGRPFRLLRLRRSFVATRSGTLSLPVSYFEFGHVARDFFRENRETFYVDAAAEEIEVRPLPEEGRPFDFSGGVGTFSVASQLDRRDVDVGDSMKLRVEWSGDANLEFFVPPDPGRLDAFSDFRVYGTTDRFLGDRRLVTYDLAPISAEVEELPSLPLSYFDTEREAYTTLATEPIPIRVRALEGAEGLAPLEGGGPALDVRDIQTRPLDPGPPGGPSDGAVGAALAALPLLWLGLRTAVRRRGDPDSPAARRKRRARKALRRELARAARASEQTTALAAFLGARSGEPPEAWVGRDPRAFLHERAEVEGEAGARAAEELAQVFARLEAAVWAGADAPLEAREIERAADAWLEVTR